MLDLKDTKPIDDDDGFTNISYLVKWREYSIEY
jgi:hypothetical protein